MKQAFQKNFYTKCNITCNALFFNRVDRKITNKKPNLNMFSQQETSALGER